MLSVYGQKGKTMKQSMPFYKKTRKTQFKAAVTMQRTYVAESNMLRQRYGLHLHHIASKAGYVSRKLECILEEYHGRFGDGYIILRPRYDTQRYVWCEYWVK